MTSYQKFKTLEGDLSQLGFISSENYTAYFCTPRGAKIIGSAGIDGIHYCFIRGFGETVFAVSPMNTYYDGFVHPVARSFKDMLALLLSCKDTAALEQARSWDREQFYSFVQGIALTAEVSSALDFIRKNFKVSPMEDPFAYIKELQSSFDYKRIIFTSDYYDPDMNPHVEAALPEWKVTYDGDFLNNSGRRGSELCVNKTFFWAGRLCRIPSVYLCGKGLAADFCMQIDPDDESAFLEKLQKSEQNNSSFLGHLLMREDPMNLLFSVKAFINGKSVGYNRCHSASWLPESSVSKHADSLEAMAVIRHYGLDSSQCWLIRRFCFPWPASRKPHLSSLRFTFSAHKSEIPGAEFNVNGPADTFTFTHPLTGSEHTLTVTEYTQYNNSFFGPDPGKEYPSFCTAMSYTLSPPIPSHSFYIRDTSDSDQPRRKSSVSDNFSPAASDDLLIIGGADGPTAISLAGSSHSGSYTVFSSLHFRKVQNVRWIIVFREKKFDDAEIEVI